MRNLNCQNIIPPFDKYFILNIFQMAFLCKSRVGFKQRKKGEIRNYLLSSHLAANQSAKKNCEWCSVASICLSSLFKSFWWKKIQKFLVFKVQLKVCIFHFKTLSWKWKSVAYSSCSFSKIQHMKSNYNYADCSIHKEQQVPEVSILSTTGA